MAFKERVEQNPIYYLLMALATGFLAGMATYRSILEIAQLDTISRHELRQLKRAAETPGTFSDDIPLASLDEPTSGATSSSLSDDQPLPAKALKPTTLEIIATSNEANANVIRQRIRERASLRPLTTLESGKPVGETPSGTYFYVWAASLGFTGWETQPDLKRASAGRAFRPRDDVEIHAQKAGGFVMLAFCSGAQAADVASLDGKTQRALTIFGTPWEEARTLIIIPVNRIARYRSRRIEIDQHIEFQAIDVVVR